jgi:iron complex transport system substrate-binding protein
VLPPQRIVCLTEEPVETLYLLGAIVDASERGRELAAMLECYLAYARTQAKRLPKQPRAFSEEWDDPLISAIGWVSELIETAGGIDVFADSASQDAAKEPVVTPDQVIERQPDLVGSRLSKKFRPEQVAARPVLLSLPLCSIKIFTR